MKYYIWGAGLLGKIALERLGSDNVIAFIDSNIQKIAAKVYLGKQILSPDEFFSIYQEDTTIYIAAQSSVFSDIEDLLLTHDIHSYKPFVDKRFISFCSGREDLIISLILNDVDDIFYIDVGANDPIVDSLTKYLYSFKDAHGINIEPQEEFIKLLNADRKRDVNLQVACGPYSTQTLYLQSGFSTLCENLRKPLLCEQSSVSVECIPLSAICEKYVPSEQPIHFLKIDVEGFERQVLESADFQNYRPWVIEIESYHLGQDVLSFSDKIATYESWEDLLINAGYHFVYETGFDRFYLADEHPEYDLVFQNMGSLKSTYHVIDYCK